MYGKSNHQLKYNSLSNSVLSKHYRQYLKVITTILLNGFDFHNILQTGTDPSNRYNVPLMNALVLYVGTQAITYIQNKSSTTSIATITHSSHMDIFQNLAVDLDTEGELVNNFILIFILNCSFISKNNLYSLYR